MTRNLLTTTDQMGREVTFSYPPRRIISLVPSQTEFLIDIGAPVVGRTKFCIHPKEAVRGIPIVGGTKQHRFDAIKALRPDLIIGNKEENDKQSIEALAKEYPVWMSDSHSLPEVYDMMQALGELTGKKENAHASISQCQSALGAVRGSKQGRVIYLMWYDPWMAAGTHTFINHMLTHLGYENAVTEPRYPVLSVSQMQQLKPDKILLSSEPFPFKVQHMAELRSVVPETNQSLVDGELYSWVGSRLRFWE